MTTKLCDYWPTSENCEECLITDAEAAPDAVVLAVHQPMRLLRKFHGSNRPEEVKSEVDVLDAFLLKNPVHGTLVLPITGASGVGKSHIIRWIDANLKLRPDHATRHVVRVPKSSSLRGVLELILRGLSSKYDPLRRELETARLTPDILQATYQIQANLLIQIELTGKSAQQRLNTPDKRPDDPARDAHCSRTGLIALLQDPAISSHFTAYDKGSKGVLARFAERFVRGSHDHNEGPPNQFREADLDFVIKESGKDLAAVTRAYLLQLKRPKFLADALQFLNEVAETALARYFDDLGGPSLAELFIKLRLLLKADGVELVLLIEDFAVMAGIREQLIQVMTTPDVVGETKLCLMRTALAVTEGMLPETVKTRAQIEWRIDNKPFATEDEAVDNFCDFIGGYLNAARCGAVRLQKTFVKNMKLRDPVTDWVPSFHAEHGEELSNEERDRLQAFGTSKQHGYPLFPFNEGAIQQLANRHLREGALYRFDPRLLINRILRATLIGYRKEYMAGEFPPEDFDGFKATDLNPTVSTEVRNRCAHQANRASAVVYYWGNNPQSPGIAARLPKSITDAFGLPKIDWTAAPEPHQPSHLPVRGIKVVPKTQTVISPLINPLGKWERLLSDWRKGAILPQGEASSLRNMLAEAVREWLDWDSMLLKAVPLRGEDIRLPNARSNPEKEKAMAVVAEDVDLKDTSKSDALFNALPAVIRYDTAKTWDYDGGEMDSAAYSILICGLAKQAEAWLRRRGTDLRPELIKPVAQALLIDARALNLDGATSNADADNLSAMLANAPTMNVASEIDPWSKFKAVAAMERGGVRDLLLKQISARQGSGDTPQAIDAAPLLAAVRELRLSWKLCEFDAALTGSAPIQVKEALRRVRDRLEIAVAARRSEVEKWQNSVIEAFGDDFTLSTLQEELRTTALEAKQNGVFRWRNGDHNYDSLRDRIKEVGPLKETLLQAARACQSDAAFGVVLSALAQLDDRTVSRSSELIEAYSKFLKETGDEVRERLRDAPPSIEEEADKIAVCLDALSDTWTHIGEEVSA